MGNRSNKRRRFEGIVTTLKTALTHTKTNNPLGDLSLLPPEIRDEIYRHSLPQGKYYWSTLLIPSGFYDHDPCLHPCTRRNEPTVLCLSKAIKEEAMSVFYLDGTFVYRYGIEELGSLVPQQSSADNMNNIEIFYNASLPAMDSGDELVNHNTSVSYDLATAGPLNSFRGDTITRKSIHIVLALCKWWRYATKMSTSPLFDALKELTGFETVTLSLAAAVAGHYVDDDDWWPKDEEWEGLYTGFGSVLYEMSISLEPSLGKSSAVSELEPQEIIDDCLSGLMYRSGIRDVVFHPRSHHAAIAKAKKEERLVLA